MIRYYVDTCIWLNLFREEHAPNGVPLWLFTEEFIIRAKQEGWEILISSVVLGELSRRLDLELVHESFQAFTFVETRREDYALASSIEASHFIGMNDCLHLAISKRMDAVLVTRDKNLLRVAKRFVKAKKPEDLLD